MTNQPPQDKDCCVGCDDADNCAFKDCKCHGDYTPQDKTWKTLVKRAFDYRIDTGEEADDLAQEIITSVETEFVKQRTALLDRVEGGMSKILKSHGYPELYGTEKEYKIKLVEDFLFIIRNENI